MRLARSSKVVVWVLFVAQSAFPFLARASSCSNRDLALLVKSFLRVDGSQPIVENFAPHEQRSYLELLSGYESHDFVEVTGLGHPKIGRVSLIEVESGRLYYVVSNSVRSEKFEWNGILTVKRLSPDAATRESVLIDVDQRLAPHFGPLEKKSYHELAEAYKYQKRIKVTGMGLPVEGLIRELRIVGGQLDYTVVTESGEMVELSLHPVMNIQRIH